MAALLYWAGIFALGFALGLIRTLWLTPLLGAPLAVTCELPIMLSASWLWSRHLVARHHVAAGAPAIAMGVSAFALLMIAEFVLGAVGFGQSPADWFASFARPEGKIGLAGQMAYACLPLIAARTRR